MKDIKKIADKIQEEIMIEVQKSYSNKVIEHWQHLSRTLSPCGSSYS